MNKEILAIFPEGDTLSNELRPAKDGVVYLSATMQVPIVPIGIDGNIICFSFDGIKNITSGEGGAVLSSDKEFIQKVKDARLLGVEKDTEKRFEGQRSWDFDVKEQGFRYHMSNIMAAIGIVQLSRVNEFINKRQKIAKNYIIELDKIEKTWPKKN